MIRIRRVMTKAPGRSRGERGKSVSDEIDLGVELDGYTGSGEQVAPPPGMASVPLADLQAQGYNTIPPDILRASWPAGFTSAGPTLPQTTVPPPQPPGWRQLMDVPPPYGQPLTQQRCAQCGRYMPDIVGLTSAGRCPECHKNWDTVRQRIKDRSKPKGSG